MLWGEISLSQRPRLVRHFWVANRATTWTTETEQMIWCSLVPGTLSSLFLSGDVTLPRADIACYCPRFATQEWWTKSSRMAWGSLISLNYPTLSRDTLGPLAFIETLGFGYFFNICTTLPYKGCTSIYIITGLTLYNWAIRVHWGGEHKFKSINLTTKQCFNSISEPSSTNMIQYTLFYLL